MPMAKSFSPGQKGLKLSCQGGDARIASIKVYELKSAYIRGDEQIKAKAILLKMKKQILFWSITSALAGFLFGFDTVVISGAEQTIQKLWGLSSTMHGLVMGSALYGTVIGSLIGGWPTDKFGRKRTLLSIGVLYVISAIGCGFADNVTMFVAARFIGGLGIGMSTVAAPLYISEIAPANYRGRLAGMFQFNIVFGILVAFAVQRHASPKSAVKIPGG